MWTRDVLRSSGGFLLAAATCCAVSLSPLVGQEVSVRGKLIKNGETTDLPYVYVYAEKDGFYDDNDPTWSVVFAAEPVEARDVDSPFMDFSFMRIGITRTSEFDDKPTLRAYSQEFKLSGDAGSVSGGTYPEVVLETAGPDLFAGRIWLPESIEIFDDTFQYDFTFSTALTDPDAPIGEALPPGGGEPGKAYVAWVKAVHSGDVEELKKVVPPEMAEMLEAEMLATENFHEQIEFMQAMTPTDIKILSGSSDGSTAVLKVEGMLDQEKMEMEITMNREGRFWVVGAQSM